MHLKHRLLATAVASTLATSFTPFLASTALAETNAADDKTIQAVTVTASPFGSNSNDQILTPAKVLSGDELRDKVGDSLGDTLSHELGVSASAFGAGASRPIIRGMEGARVKVLQNGMSVSDVSGLSNDHAVESARICQSSSPERKSSLRATPARSATVRRTFINCARNPRSSDPSIWVPDVGAVTRTFGSEGRKAKPSRTGMATASSFRSRGACLRLASPQRLSKSWSPVACWRE